MTKLYITPNDVLPELARDYNSGSPYGTQLGFQSTHNKITLRTGSFSLWYGWPQHGKTTLVIALCAQIAKREGKIFLIYCPEEGDAKDITRLIASIWIGKDFYKRDGGANRGTFQEFERAVMEFSQYFLLVPTYIKGFESAIKYCNECEAELNQHIWSMVIDPINTLITTHSGVAGEYEEGYTLIEMDAKRNARHHILITHPVDDPHKSSEKEESGIKYLPHPNPNNLMGGKTHFRRGQLMIGVWRPKAGLTNPKTGTGYDGSEILLMVQKAKPRGSSEVGDYLLRYDESRWTFTDQDAQRGGKVQSKYESNGMTPPETDRLNLTPLKSFYEKDNDPLPF